MYEIQYFRAPIVLCEFSQRPYSDRTVTVTVTVEKTDSDRTFYV